MIDYDLAVAYFLEETDHLHIGPVPQSVNRILNDFEALRPLTGRQHDLRQCALHIKQTLVQYEVQPGYPKPFALRFPTLKSLKLLTSLRSQSLRPIDSQRAVILVDLAGRLLAILLPPNPRANQETCEDSPTGDISPEVTSITSKSSYMNDLSHNQFLPPRRYQARALKALEGAASIHKLPQVSQANQKPAPTDQTLTTSPCQHHPVTARLSRAKNQAVNVTWSTYGSLPYEALGFALGSVCIPKHYPTPIHCLLTKPIPSPFWFQPDTRADTRMKLGFERQGWTIKDCGDLPKSDRHLPQISGLGESSPFKRMENARIISELLWPYEVSRALNAAVNPPAYEAAHQAVKFIQDNGGTLLSQRIQGMHNRIIHGTPSNPFLPKPLRPIQSLKTKFLVPSGAKINYNIQVAPH